MNKTIKVIYLLMMLLIVNTCVAFAQSEEKNTQTYNWQAFDIGPAEDYNYAFDTNSIKYARNEDGSINKNIIIYQEKKINNVPMSSEFNYYTITQCKLKNRLLFVLVMNLIILKKINSVGLIHQCI